MEWITNSVSPFQFTWISWNPIPEVCNLRGANTTSWLSFLERYGVSFVDRFNIPYDAVEVRAALDLLNSAHIAFVPNFWKAAQDLFPPKPKFPKHLLSEVGTSRENFIKAMEIVIHGGVVATPEEIILLSRQSHTFQTGAQVNG